MSGVLLIAEARRGELRDVSFELATAAGRLAAAGCTPVRACLIGGDAAALAPRLAVEGVDEVLAVPTPTDGFDAATTTSAVRALVERLAPDVVLAGHTVDAMGFAPAVAALSGLGLATDATAVDWEDGAAVVHRGAYGDRLTARLEFPGQDAAVVLVRAGAYPPARSPGPAVSQRVDLELAAPAAEHLGFRDAERSDVDIAASDFLLSIGRGVDEEHQVAGFQELALAVGATLSSSRPLVDAGWLPAARQVGQSGKAVAPKVYLALGISGAVQHLVGMRGSDTVIAVNTDPEAPIFGVADYGAVADLHDVAAALGQHFR